MEFEFESAKDQLITLAGSKDWPACHTLVKDFHPADTARLFNLLDEEELAGIFRLFRPEPAGQILVELDEVQRRDLYEDTPVSRLAAIIQTLPSDEAADVLGELDDGPAAAVLQQLDRRDSEELQELLQHEETSAGGLMAKEFFVIRSDRTVREAINKIRSLASKAELVYNLYAVDPRSRLVGVVSLKDLIVATPDTPVADIMDTDIHAVRADTDQEEVASLMQDYDLVSMPVVDEQDRLIGRITIDDAVDVIEEEASEDILKMAGTSEEDMTEDTVLRSVRARLPWLVVGLVGGTMSALVMSRFEMALNQMLALAFFVPVIIGMAGNVGVQSSAIVVRGIAVGEIGDFNFWYHFFKETVTGLMNGLVLGAIACSVVYAWQRDLRLALTISLAMVTVVIVAATLGALYPLALKKARIDPAVATGPFITTSNDVIGLFIYFSIARMLF